MTLQTGNEQLYLFSAVHEYRYRETIDLGTPTSRTPVNRLVFVVAGKGTMNIGGQIDSVEPLQLYFVPEEAELQGMLFGRHIQYYVVDFHILSLSRRGERWIGEPSSALPSLLQSGHVALKDSAAIHLEFKQLHETNLLPDNRVQSNLLLQNLLLQIYRQREIQSLPLADTTSQWNGIEESIRYMQAHLNKKINRDRLAAIAQLTPSSYCRSFKKAKGVAPMDYLNHLRVEKAKQLLASGTTCKQAAERLGYASEYYFSRVFKKTTGLPPTIYLKREHSRIAVASRFGIHLNLESMGVEPVVVIDCYPHPGIEQEDYNRRLMSQLEELRMAQPDLIIGDYSHSTLYDTFKRIAPTVLLKYDLDWLVPHRKLAEIVGRESEAQQVIEELDERIARARQQISRMDQPQRVAMMQMMSDHVYLQGTTNHPLNKLLYSELGLLPGKHIPRHKMRVELYPAHLPAIEVDHLWIRLYSDTADVLQTLQRTQEQRCWEGIAAVRNDQVRFIANWLIMSWTPQGRGQIVEEVLSYLKIAQNPD